MQKELGLFSSLDEENDFQRPQHSRLWLQINVNNLALTPQDPRQPGEDHNTNMLFYKYSYQPRKDLSNIYRYTVMRNIWFLDQISFFLLIEVSSIMFSKIFLMTGGWWCVFMECCCSKNTLVCLLVQLNNITIDKPASK